MNIDTPPLKVVIVEDNASLNDIYKTRLEILGYECFSAFDGEEALRIIEAETPNLVLLDLMVPRVAGDQILATMRASDWGKDINVLIISNLNEADAPAGLREYGISGYAVKVNLTNDDIDHLVDDILKPTDQTEVVDLESTSEQMSPVERPAVQAPAVIEGERITTFLTFASRGKEAVDFYLSVFSNSRLDALMQMPGSGQLLHASFMLDGHHFMAMEAGDTFHFDQGISLFVTCADQAEVDYYWDKLSADGGAPGRCGWVVDKFGISWQIVPTALGRLMSDPDQEASGRVMQAMLGMNKLDVAGLERAHAGENV